MTIMCIFSFGFLLYAMPPIRFFKWGAEKDCGKAAWTGFFLTFIFLIYRANVLIRNFLPYVQGRSVFAYSNLDISFWSFVVQEFVDTIAMLLLMLVWIKSLTYARAFAGDPVPFNKDHSYAKDPDTLKDLSRLYLQWQISSALIAIPFLAITYFYYSLIYKDHDERYFPQAINSHVLWGVTWIIVSLPLLRAHYKWMTAKQEEITMAMKSENGARRKKEFELLEPFGAVNFIITAFMGIFSFFLPLLQALK